MSTIKWQTTITEIGPEVSAFVDENILVLFDTTAPDELTEFAALHPPTELAAPVAAGDIVWFDEHSFRVISIGTVANENLANLGHAVFKCNGRQEPEMPGDICLDDADLPPIDVGTKIRIESDEG